MSLRLKVIIALMSMALLGLVLIQFYWIDNAIVLKRDEFNQKVVQAMRQVVHDLEKHDAVENIRRHREGRKLLHQQMRKRNKIMMQQRREAMRLRSQAKNNRKRGRWKVTKEYSQDSSMHFITREYIDTDSNIMISKMERKSQFLDDMILDLMEVDRYRSIEERINPGLLDSLLKKEFAEYMINTDMEFAVYDYFGRNVFSNEEANQQENEELRKSIFKARLFPNDVFAEPFFLSLYFPDQKSFLLKSMWITLSVSAIFLLLIVAAFSYTIHVIQNQKQLSLIKNDFISNMTHELKTPISTISLACEALGDQDISEDKQKKQRFLTMISQENSRLAMLVENVLKSSIWDKSDFKLNLESVDLHEIIEEVAETTSVIVTQKGGSLNLNLNASKSILQGDKVHLTNILYNLVDNAIKYSPEKLDISVSTSSNQNEMLIEVQDNGLGIPKDQQKKVFDKFYRVPTGNIHNVKGFGLGLNYVKNVIRNHGGEIKVKSNSGKGSSFFFNIPYNFNG